MTEAAHHATPEIGRGTPTFDGLALPSNARHLLTNKA